MNDFERYWLVVVWMVTQWKKDEKRENDRTNEYVHRFLKASLVCLRWSSFTLINTWHLWKTRLLLGAVFKKLNMNKFNKWLPSSQLLIVLFLIEYYLNRRVLNGAFVFDFGQITYYQFVELSVLEVNRGYKRNEINAPITPCSKQKTNHTIELFFFLSLVVSFN